MEIWKPRPPGSLRVCPGTALLYSRDGGIKSNVRNFCPILNQKFECQSLIKSPQNIQFNPQKFRPFSPVPIYIWRQHISQFIVVFFLMRQKETKYSTGWTFRCTWSSHSQPPRNLSVRCDGEHPRYTSRNYNRATGLGLKTWWGRGGLNGLCKARVMARGSG